MTLRELQEKRARLVTQARDALESIKSNTDETRSAELESRHDAIMADLDKLDAQIAREQRMAQLEHEENERREREAREMRNRRPPHGQTEAPAGSEGGDISYRQAFFEYIRAGGQEALMEPETRAALRAGYRNLSTEERAQVTGSAAAGGYTVPTELQAVLIKAMKMWGPMYDGGITGELITTSGAALPFPTTDDTGARTNGTTQGQTLPDDGSGDVIFGQKSLGAYAYATPWLRVSKELADDSILNMEAILGDLLGERMGRSANDKLTFGTGVNMPTGVAVAAGTGWGGAASAAAIAYDDTINLLHAVDPAYRSSPKARYMFHDTTLQAIRKLKDSMGRYIWSAGDVQSDVPATINGYRFSINQAMDQIATGKTSMLFGDFGKYMVRKVGAPLIGAIQDKDFWPGFGLAAWHRFDGQLLDSSALKGLKHP